jgi:putative NIF3 family GTP cyclohydrolase 1 type 2
MMKPEIAEITHGGILRMKRREFIQYGGALSLMASLPAQKGIHDPAGKSNPEKKLRAGDVQAYLRSLNRGWIDEEKTVDTFKSGSPAAEITGIAVAWMSYTWALKRALELGLNMFITHEPTYFEHRDNDPAMFEIEGVSAKKRFIEESGIVILRCHDLWDRYPDIGITDGWARLLGFSDPVFKEGYFRVFDVSGRTAGEVARQVARKVSPLGQEAVQFIGEESTHVKRVAIGYGAATPYRHFITELKADLAICSDDGFTFWRDGALAIDLGLPVIIVNHPVTEENGMRLLAEHLAGRFPQVPVTPIPQRCMYRLVKG